MKKQQILEEEKIEGGKKMKPILIVEDEAIMRESLRDWLTDIGYQVETAEGGKEALKIVTEQDFGVAILDLRLPGKDGLEVLREAKAKRPQLKGIIITAYPSVGTAIEAMREGVVDYLPKPLDLNGLEKLIRNILGPVQVEMKPKAVTKEAIAEPIVAEEARVVEVIAVTPEEIPAHLKQGKAHFAAGRYQEALKEFEAVLMVAPGNIETRVWIRKTREALVAPMVAYRICTHDYDCLTCEFDQMMQEKMASGEAPELDAALERFEELPGNQRLCRYALKGDVSYRLCSRTFQCVTCEFSQMMEDALQQKLAKLAARREALLKKEQRTEAKA